MEEVRFFVNNPVARLKKSVLKSLLATSNGQTLAPSASGGLAAERSCVCDVDSVPSFLRLPLKSTILHSTKTT